MEVSGVVRGMAVGEVAKVITFSELVTVTAVSEVAESTAIEEFAISEIEFSISVFFFRGFTPQNLGFWNLQSYFIQFF